MRAWHLKKHKLNKPNTHGSNKKKHFRPNLNINEMYISISIYERYRNRAFKKQPPEVFLESSQNSQENTCAKVSFLIRLQVLGLRPATLLKKRHWHSYFPVNFAKFVSTPFLQNTSGRLIL